MYVCLCVGGWVCGFVGGRQVNRDFAVILACTYKHTTHTRVFVRVYVCAYVCVWVWVCGCVWVYIHTCMLIYTHIYTHNYKHTYYT